MRLKQLKTRDDIGSVLNEMDLYGDGAEVGVEYGINAELILSTSRLKCLFLVDAWDYIPGHDPRGFGVGYGDWKAVYSDFRKRMLQFGKRARVFTNPSNEAVGWFIEGQLDFCYIDANHMSPWIDEDLVSWFPKVRVGGIIGGHDYLDRNEPTFQCDVKRVVDVFFADRPESVHVTEDPVPSWYVVKES